jgi:hypothetical protein
MGTYAPSGPLAGGLPGWYVPNITELISKCQLLNIRITDIYKAEMRGLKRNCLSIASSKSQLLDYQEC